MERGEGSSNPQKSDGLNDTRMIGESGLKLTITPNLIKLVEKTSAEDTALRKEFPPDPKSKASNVHALSLTIGNWQKVAEHNGDIIAKCYFAKKKLVWEVLIDTHNKKKFEFTWDNITAIRATFHEEQQPSTLQVELGKQPIFFEECTPQPRKNTTWECCTDFTNGEARIHRMHTLTFIADGKLEKFYQKLIHFTPDLYLASRRSFESLEFPLFEKVDRPSSPLRNYNTNGPLPQLNPEMFADMNVFTDPSSVNCYRSTIAADVNAAMMHGGITPDPALSRNNSSVMQHPLYQPQPQPQPQAPIYRVMPISAQPQPQAPEPEGFNWTGGDEQYYLGDPSSLIASSSEGFNMEDACYGYYPNSFMASATSLEEDGMSHQGSSTMYSPQMGAGGFGGGSADLGIDLAIAAAHAQVPAPPPPPPPLACGYSIPPQMMAPGYCSQYPVLQASHNGGYGPPPPMVQSNYGGRSTGYQMPPESNDGYQLPPLPNQLVRFPRYQ